MQFYLPVFHISRIHTTKSGRDRAVARVGFTFGCIDLRALDEQVLFVEIDLECRKVFLFLEFLLVLNLEFDPMLEKVEAVNLLRHMSISLLEP